MKLFVTGAAGFIGSNYVRLVLGVIRRRGHRVRRPDLRRQPGEPRRPGRRPPVPLRPRRHLRPRRRADGHGRPRRRRPLRGREPRRPLHRQPRRLRAHQLRRHQRAVRRGPPGRGRALPPHLHRRGLRLDRGGLVHARPTRSGPRSPVLGLQGRQRPASPSATTRTYGLPVIVTRSSNNFGPVPVPGEGDPAVRHQPARRPQGAALRRRRQRPRLVLRGRQLPRQSTWCCARAPSARSTTSAPATRSPTGS